MTHPTDQQRYLALDVFRGIVICFMIIVNSPGDWHVAYAPLLHAKWHGFTPTDLVFPSFMFAVGNAMVFAMHKYELQDGYVFWSKTLKRTIIIFVIGYLMYWFPFVQEVGGSWQLRPIATTRIFGVLQRIALSYFIASIVIHFGSKKFILWFSALALISYWIIMRIYGDPNDPYSLTGNAALRLDLFVLGDKHLYHGEGIAFDPEGILSTLPAIVNVIAGYFAGNYIRKKGNNYEAIAKLLMVGVILVLGALIWNMTFPINKKLWTSSFVLVTVGIDLMILPILIYIIEIRKYKKWTSFFSVFGRNPLFIYLFSELLLVVFNFIYIGDLNVQQWFFNRFFGSFASPINASFLFAFFFMLTCWMVGFVLDKRRIYITV